MVSWNEFAARASDVAAAGRDLLYDVGVGLAFLATVRADGAPRVHPICPLVSDAGLHAFVIPSPKRRDLRRDGRYALHSFPMDDNEDAFHLTGLARPVPDEGLREALAARFVAERAAFGVAAPGPEQELFAFDVETALLTRTTGHGDPAPRHTVWRAEP
jgi:hypothetical protein